MIKINFAGMITALIKQSVQTAILGLVALLLLTVSCKKTDIPLPKAKPTSIDSIAAKYYEQYLKLYPLEATTQGDSRYDDQLPIDISQDFIAGEIGFYNSVLDEMKQIDYKALPDDKKIIYDVLEYTLKDKLERYAYHPEYIPFTQFDGLPLKFPLLGSGQGSQPFKTPADYANWNQRMEKFPEWMDAATVNFRAGMKAGVVLPQKLVAKIIPQLTAEEIISEDPEKNIFFGPVRQFPTNFTDKQKEEFTRLYTQTVKQKIIPAYRKMADFLQKEYIQNARVSDGYYGLPGGRNMYAYYAKSWTTTNLTPEQIKKIGEAEVAKLRAEMEKVKTQVGYQGSLEEFLTHLQTEKKAMPYQNASEVLAGFNKILNTLKPQLGHMFHTFPKTPFEIRQTEKFREASASAEYIQGSADGSRPGIFYIPLPHPEKFNVASGMESLFLHEAIPGHHFQISLQQENIALPKFMRFGWFGAYGEGWAHYCETLGPEFGLYTDPYQKMGYLSDQMLRAVRLVIDTGIHTGTMSREGAIAYFLKNVAYDEASATAEVERYMAMPGQALSYKIGALKIRELRTLYENKLGTSFDLAAFHDELLNQGCLPISVLERKMKLWADKVQKQKKGKQR